MGLIREFIKARNSEVDECKSLSHEIESRKDGIRALILASECSLTFRVRGVMLLRP